MSIKNFCYSYCWWQVLTDKTNRAALLDSTQLQNISTITKNIKNNNVQLIIMYLNLFSHFPSDWHRSYLKRCGIFWFFVQIFWSFAYPRQIPELRESASFQKKKDFYFNNIFKSDFVVSGAYEVADSEFFNFRPFFFVSSSLFFPKTGKHHICLKLCILSCAFLCISSLTKLKIEWKF